jgi:rhamnulokinase
MNRQTYLAVDLGAESGRVIALHLGDEGMAMESCSRFSHGEHPEHPGCWNLPAIQAGILEGLRFAAAQSWQIASIGIDCWGVDYLLLDAAGAMLRLPRQYRSASGAEDVAALNQRIPREEQFALTGIQPLPFNTCFQLQAHRNDFPEHAAEAHDLLFIPDFLHCWLSGERVNEASIASTSGLVAAADGRWHPGLLAACGARAEWFRDTTAPGTRLGSLRPALQAECGLGAVPIVVPASHDTASAVAAVPATEADWAWMSSGTWSLLGIDSEEAICTPAALDGHFSNEGGLAGGFRFLKNINGLYLLQRLRGECFADLDYDAIMRLAESDAPAGGFFDAAHADFLNPPEMRDCIVRHCTANGWVPANERQVLRCLMESLALEYAYSFATVEALSGRSLKGLHIVGGGSMNSLLNQLTANALGRPVLAGPKEATAIGNALCQAMGLGHLAGPAALRACVARHCQPVRFEPTDGKQWQTARQRYAAIKD